MTLAQIFTEVDSLELQNCHCAVFIWEDDGLHYKVMFSPDRDECESWVTKQYYPEHIKHKCQFYIDHKRERYLFERIWR